MLDESGRRFATWNLLNWKFLGFKSMASFEKIGKKDFRKANICPVEVYDIYDKAFHNSIKKGYSDSAIIYQTQDGKFEYNYCPCLAEKTIMSIIEKCGGRWYGIIMTWSV